MKKKFDCVEMKNMIQTKLRLQREGMSDQAIQDQVEEELAVSQSPVAKYWRAISGKRGAVHQPRSVAKC